MEVVKEESRLPYKLRRTVSKRGQAGSSGRKTTGSLYHLSTGQQRSQQGSSKLFVVVESHLQRIRKIQPGRIQRTHCITTSPGILRRTERRSCSVVQRPWPCLQPDRSRQGIGVLRESPRRIPEASRQRTSNDRYCQRQHR